VEQKEAPRGSDAVEMQQIQRDMQISAESQEKLKTFINQIQECLDDYGVNRDGMPLCNALAMIALKAGEDNEKTMLVTITYLINYYVKRRKDREKKLDKAIEKVLLLIQKMKVQREQREAIHKELQNANRELLKGI